MVKQENSEQVDTSKESVLSKKTPVRLGGDVAFPRNSLKESIELPKAIWRDNAGEAFDPILLAQSLNTTHRSSKFTTLSASSQRYGLTMGGEFAKGVSLTELGKSIAAPTDDSIIGSSLRKALLTPKVFEKIYLKYDRKNIPRSEIVKTVLERECGVPREHVQVCYDTIIQNITDYHLAIKTGDSEILYLDNLGKEISTATKSQEEGISTEDITETTITPTKPELKPELKVEQIPKVFISHSKNIHILEQMKDMLEFGNFEYVIAVEEETSAIPIPDKVFGLMRDCNCAIINVSADEENKQSDNTYRINENVLIEIGGAFIHYNKRVILLVDKRITLPSNLQGLYRCEYEGDELSWNVAMRLQKALSDFRKSL